MRIKTRWLVLRMLVGLLPVALAACGAATSSAVAAAAAPAGESHEGVTNVAEDGSIAVAPSVSSSALNPIPADELSPVEIEGILFMREEEKLARDVYLKLYDRWELPIFRNIANSEATHMEAIKTLIDRYSDLRLDYRINPWFEGISIRCANPRPGRC